MYHNIITHMKVCVIYFQLVFLYNNTYKFPTSIYSFDYNGDYTERIIYLQNFTVGQTTNIRAELGDNFLISDMDFYIYSYVDNT